MEPVVERCSGLDVHQASVTACLLVGPPGKRPRKVVRTFRTMRAELAELRTWLESEGVTHVAMESTGVYWMPVYAELEGHFELVVGNATHIKNVPGRKTDVKDSEWLADLCRHGLIRKSFVPPKPLRQLRELLRYRRKIVQARSAERNRLVRLLETANIKLSAVMSDVFGASGRAMLRAIVADSFDPAEVANLARGTLRKKTPDLTLALDGRLDDEHRFLLSLQLGRLDSIEQDLEQLDARIDLRLEPYRAEFGRLTQIPGVDRLVAATILAELGTDMTVFPTVRHAAAWAGVCPGNYESAGKRRKVSARKGNIHLLSALTQAAVALARTREAKGGYLRAKYWKLATRVGKKKAAVAIAHKILIAAYNMLARGAVYADLGADYLDHRNRRATTRNLVRRLENLGYEVTLAPSPAAQPPSATFVAAGDQPK